MTSRDHLIQASIKIAVLVAVISLTSCKRVDPASGNPIPQNGTTTQSSNPRVCTSNYDCVERVCYAGTSYLITNRGGITPEVESGTNGFVRSC